MSENNTQETLRDRVLSSLEERGITPKPRWHFLVREGVVWIVAFCAFVVGSVASALSIYIMDASRFMERTIELSTFDTLFEAVPFVWFGLFGIALLYGIHALRETRRGYRLPTAWLVVAAFVGSVGVGAFLYEEGIGARIDTYLLANAPLYQPMSGFRILHWMQPREGVVAGVVLEVRGDSFTMRGIDGTDMRIVRSTSTVRTCPYGEGNVREGVNVRVVGTSTTDGGYEAYAVCAFRGRGAPPHTSHAGVMGRAWSVP